MKTSTLIRLDGTLTSYILDARGPGIPRCVYWGPRDQPASGAPLPPRAAEEHAIAAPLMTLPANMDAPVAVSLMPEHGFGFFGQPALLGARGQHDWATQFQVSDIDVEAGGEAVAIRLVDERAALELVLDIRMDRQSDVIARRATLVNRGTGAYALTWLAAAAWQLPGYANEALLFHGAWLAEFRTTRVPLAAGVHLRESRRSRHSHGAFPGAVIGTAGFDDQHGEVYGFTLGWSGPHRVMIETLQEGLHQLQAGALLTPGEVVLAPGQSTETPWCYGAMSQEGINGLSERLHRFVRGRILPPQIRTRPRPVHLNTWEAVYFFHRLDQLKELANRAARIGVERFVLDDGWFQGRQNDTSSLGDWWVDKGKYPDGLRPLIDHVRGLGMGFGLWVEPEMVNPESALYRAHPTWAVHLPDRPTPTARHQLVLDLTQKEVADYLFERVDALLREYAIEYLKWDYNRDLAPAADAQGRPGAAAQVHAFYGLVDRLRAAHPGVEIESCASGGGRMDYEVLRRTERFWVSDCNDALERQRIQHGASIFFPLEVLGSHIGPARSHTTGRQATLPFRARTAIFGHLGLELNLGELSDDDLGQLARHIEVYKRFRDLLHSGRLYRFGLGDDTGQGWLVVSEDRARALASLVRLRSPTHHLVKPARLPGLDPARQYRVEVVEPIPFEAHIRCIGDFLGQGTVLSGHLLTHQGLPLAPVAPESAVLLALHAVDAAR